MSLLLCHSRFWLQHRLERRGYWRGIRVTEIWIELLYLPLKLSILQVLICKMAENNILNLQRFSKKIRWTYVRYIMHSLDYNCLICVCVHIGTRGLIFFKSLYSPLILVHTWNEETSKKFYELSTCYFKANFKNWCMVSIHHEIEL